jgi:hypothetical protein
MQPSQLSWDVYNPLLTGTHASGGAKCEFVSGPHVLRRGRAQSKTFAVPIGCGGRRQADYNMRIAFAEGEV